MNYLYYTNINNNINLSTESTEVEAIQKSEHKFILPSTEDDLTKVDAKTEQLTELFEEVQQRFQLTADVDSFGDELVSKQKEEEEEDTRQPKVLRTSFQLGRGCRQDRHLDVVGNEIILASKRSPFRKITFTLNCLAHLMSYLNDIDAIVKRLDYAAAADENECRQFVSRKHLGDG